MLYVHVDEKNAPYLDAWSNEAKDGYKKVVALLDRQIVAVIKFTDKCYLDENGALIAPNQLPLSDQEQKQVAAEAKLQTLSDSLDKLQADNEDLKKQLAEKAVADEAQKGLINILTKKLNDLGKEGAK